MYFTALRPSWSCDFETMNQATELATILSGIGSTADEIAATLRGIGIHGARNTVRFLNPVVRYCQNHLLLDDYALDVMQRGFLRIQMPSLSRSEERRVG